mmetsp:Transcript_2460/g.5311  ORF Transcript_2460/g.5311 Transcript_2460/m.5311 type:complete len:277 (-) Transcript_2460:567-1397(-)
MFAAKSNSKADASSRAAAAAKQTQAAFHKTRMCRFYLLGVCNRGEACVFAHTKEELCPPPDFTCTRLCERLLATGQCTQKDCKFAHCKEELRGRKHSKKARAAASVVPPVPATLMPVPSSNSSSASNIAAEMDDVFPATLQINLKGKQECCEDEDLGQVPTWSRQSTATTDSLRLDTSSFSRFTSVDSEWAGSFPSAAAVVAPVPARAAVTPPSSQSEQMLVNFPRVEMTLSAAKPKGSFGGLPCEVKNTFLHFASNNDDGAFVGRRVRSASLPRQ